MWFVRHGERSLPIPVMGTWLAFLCLHSRCGAAEFDPLLNRPCKIQIVLHFGGHRVLTAAFKDQAAHEVQAQCRLALGAAAEVEVGREHPLLAEVLANGLQQALDGWQELSDVQTHFVLIDYRAGRYVVQSRFHDGISGLNAPLVERAEFGDRGLVAAQAARMVHAGLGIAGVITRTGPTVEVALQAGGLSGMPDERVRPGDVFAVTRIVRDGGKPRSIPVTWALLRIARPPKAGVCQAEYFCRYEEDQLTATAPQVASFRCLQLPAAKLPLRLRLLDAESLQPLTGLQVHIGSRGFQDTVRELVPDRDGLVETREPLEKAAFVRVVDGGTVRAQFPVALIDTRTVLCRLKLQPQSESLALLQYRRDEWLRRALDAALVTSSRMQQLNTVLGQSLETAQAYAKVSLESLDRDLASLETERRELKRQADRKELKQLDLTEGDERLTELRRRRDEIAGLVARLQSSLQEGNSEKSLAALKLLERARLLESEADYDQAISLYEQFLQQNAQQPRVRDHLRQLQSAWKAADAEHRQARHFIYHEWINFDAAGLKANLEKARQAFQTCRAKGDALSLQKLLHLNLAHVADMKKRLTILQRQEGQDNGSEARLIAEVAEGLRELHAEVAAFVRAKS